LLELSRECKNFSVYNFVSTVAVNLESTKQRKVTEEKLYYKGLPYTNPDKVIDEIMGMSEEVAEKRMPQYLNNTLHMNYSFSKHMFEKSLVKNHKEIPAIISRAAVITNSLREPFPQYTDQV